MRISKKIMDDIDVNIRPLVKILNDKNYLTTCSCEGHREKSVLFLWFKAEYDFPIKPPSEFINEGRFYKWEYESENEKSEAIRRLEEWAKSLEKREIKRVMLYSLLGKKNDKWKILYSSENQKGDYEKIKERKSKSGYTEFKEYEQEVKIW